ncbi:MAG: hypothetical protein ACLFQV_04730, partial [Vulcanimicrobiota bacterium]
NWVDAGRIGDLLKPVSGSVDYDSGARLMAVNFEQSPAEMVFPSPINPGHAFTLVVNGKIYKTGFLERSDKPYIPLEVLRQLFKALGSRIDEDRVTRVMAVDFSRDNGDDTEAGGSSITTPVLSGNGEEIGPEKVREIGAFMDSLKKIFKNNKPGNSEISRLILAIVSPEETKIDYREIQNLQNSYDNIIARIEKLTAPDDETHAIKNMAINVFVKMKRVSELAYDLASTEKDMINKNAMDEIIVLLRSMQSEAVQFDNCVRSVRRRYKLGEP